MPLRLFHDNTIEIRTHKLSQPVPSRTWRKASCTASFGVAQLLPGESTANLLARADASLYHSKKSGRNRVYSETDTSVAWLREAHQIMTRQAERSRGPAPFAETLNALLAR